MTQLVGGLPLGGQGAREPNIPRVPPENRYNALILPSDAQYTQIEDEFRLHLADPRVAVGDVLNKYFTPHEAKLFLPNPESTSLVQIQDENTQRYRDILRTRFRGHPLSLASKFAMLYFGLPIEPAISHLFDAQRPRFDLLDDNATEGGTARPPLHFLTAHDQRNYGYDHRRGREAGHSTLPVAASSLRGIGDEPVLGLRGGATDDELQDDELQDDELQDDELQDDELQDDELQDDELQDDELQDDYPDNFPVEEGDENLADDDVENPSLEKDVSKPVPKPASKPAPKPASKTAPKPAPGDDVVMKDVSNQEQTTYRPPATASLPSQTWLYGFQGRIYIDVMKRKEAERGLEALLSMRPGHDCDVILQRYNATTHQKQDETFFQTHADVINYIADHFTLVQTAWFVHRAGEKAPETYIPSTSTFDTLVELNHVDRGQPRVAYFRTPSKTWFNGPDENANLYWDFGANHYMPFLQNAQEVLLGRPPEGRRGPHALLRYALGDGSKIKTNQGRPATTHWYGGNEINANVFFWMVPPTPDTRHTLQLLRRDLDPRSAVLLAPGNPNLGGVFEIPWPFSNLRRKLDSFCHDEYPNTQIESFFVWSHDEFLTGHRSMPMGQWDPREDDVDKLADTELHMTRLMQAYVTETHGNGCAFVFQPQYERDIADDTTCQLRLKGWEGTAPFPEQLESVDMLYEQLIVASTNVAEGQPVSRTGALTMAMLKNNLVSLADGPVDSPNTRTFVVLPTTSHDEMRAMRRQMTSQIITAELLSNNHSDFIERMTASNSSSHPWGPRYGLVNQWRERIGFETLPKPGDPVFEELKKKLGPSSKNGSKAGDNDKSKKDRLLTDEEIWGKDEEPFLKHEIDQRELSWARQPSIWDSGTYNPSIPTNAPPREAIMRIGKGRVPVLSKGTLTPTEVARMQRDFHELRNLNIQRIAFCPFPNCNFSYRVDKMDKISRHLRQHTTNNCPWCPEKLYEHWDKPQRDRHFKIKHEAELRSVLKPANKPVTNPFIEKQQQQEANGAIVTRTLIPQPFSWTAKPNSIFEKVVKRPTDLRVARLPPNKANPKEMEFSFCDRCGRDHNMLDDAKDRRHHDRVCVPHAEGAGACTFCQTCGSHVWNTENDALNWDPTAKLPHRCRGLAHSGKPFCTSCGLSLGQYSDEYIDKHREFCGAFFSVIGTFCPYCQLKFDTAPGADKVEDMIEAKKVHINACRNDHVHPSLQVQRGQMTPFDLYDEDYWREWTRPYDEQYDGPRAFNQVLRLPHRATKALLIPLAWWEKQGPRDSVVDPPQDCGVCRAALVGLDASSVLHHFEADHNDDKPLETCPLCDLSFTAPVAEGETQVYLASRAQQQRHMECHVFDLWNDVRINSNTQKTTHPTENPFRQGHPLWDPKEYGLDRRDKRCPAFAVCGAMVGFMTPEQWLLHKKQVHGSEEWQLETPEQIASGMRAARAAKELRTEKKKGSDDSSDDGDDGSGKKAPQEKMPGEETTLPKELPKGDFTVVETDYCSRCLRKMPRKNNIGPGKLSWEQQVMAHCDPKRSCRIPYQRGSEAGSVPNRSGFLSKVQMSNLGGITKLRSNFATGHPTYARTIYPTDGNFARSTTTWEFDPNRNENSNAWGMPFPPPPPGGTGGGGGGSNNGSGDKGDKGDTAPRSQAGQKRAMPTPKTPAASKTTGDGVTSSGGGSGSKRKRGDARTDPSYRPSKEELAMEQQEVQKEVQEEEDRRKKDPARTAKRTKHV
ncbi:uncharacterized protein VDAG_06745 [Verticillium dahliae VdLs.17]|uniref:Uncharacterized protein n=1 Tax=Verticillium dahliae (strain VdLs.17 / ATCC MYA-4575 / FGSC 10137) TaxID=498257 RepID=G2X9B3_VERDV|nr:uncharacterized protein VDAG_06745 [Verticillium dahliae VdLs.17]EGY15581.1 hypothetical protein VDAG_06745 [Verticillium dahliae VdLs.17]